MRQVLAARLDDPAIEQDVDPVGDDVVEQALIVSDDDHGARRRAQGVDAVCDGLERVDVQPRVGLVQDGELRLEHRHLEDLVALLFAAGKALVDGTVQQPLLELDELDLLAHQLKEIHRVQLLQAAVLPDRVQRGLEEVSVAHSGNLDRILEGEEDALARPLVGRHREEILAAVGDAALGDLVAFAAGEHRGERRFSGAVRAHDRMHLAIGDRQVDAFQDLAAVRQPRMQVTNFKHHPTLPSRLTASSFCASTANSIGSSFRTSLQKPLTIKDSASSSESPRWRQ